MSDASLGGVDRFGYPADQDSKTVKVYSQAGIEIYIGEKSLVSLGARGKFNVILARSQECVARTWPQKLEVWVCKWTQCNDLLNEILGESAPSSNLKQIAIKWSETIVMDARDVYDNASTEKEGLPQQKAVTLEIATIREWLVN